MRFFDVASLTQFKVHNVPHMAESASYCAAKQRFVAGGEDLWVYLYDFETGAELECNKGHHGPVHAVRWSPVYEAYASGSEDGTIRIWPIESPGSESEGTEKQAS